VTETTPPTALIVHAHPEPSSFSTAQAHRARQTLEADGWAVEFVELYARGFDPVLDRGEFAPVDGPFKPQREQWAAVRAGTLAEEVRTDLDDAERAGGLLAVEAAFRLPALEVTR
jgi:NAD(P)H dehydrogenase (quinone)